MMVGRQHRNGGPHFLDEWCLPMLCRHYRTMIGLKSRFTVKEHRGLHTDPGNGWCRFYGCEAAKEGTQ